MSVRRLGSTMLAVVALVFVACGDDNNGDTANDHAAPDSTATTSPSVTPPAAATACEPGPPHALPEVLPEPGQPFTHCGITVQVTGTCASNNGDGLSITGNGFTPNGLRKMFAFNVTTGAAYLDIANHGQGVGVGPVEADGTIPDGVTWDCHETRSNVPDPEGTYLVGYVDLNSPQDPKPWGYATFVVSYN